MSLDRIDRHILEVLQQKGRISTADLSELVGLSASPCARRLKRLEEEGYIDGYHAQLNLRKAGITMKFFVEVSLTRHSSDTIAAFEQEVLDIDEIINCQIVAGSYDYLLEVVSKDLEHYELFTRKLHKLDNIKDIHTYLSVRQVKSQSVLPLYT
jgi:Lrp/AsnC family leucine-responsive transcriptional regulator